VWETGHDLETLLATAHKPGVVSRVRLVEKAFAEAMGGRPSDVDVRMVVVEGALGAGSSDSPTGAPTFSSSARARDMGGTAG
jgi:hypothetical protein